MAQALIGARAGCEPQGGVPVAISVDIDEKTPDATDRNWQAERGAYREHRRPPRSRKLVRDAGRGPAPRWKPASCRSALNIGRLRSGFAAEDRSEEHTSELQSLMRISYDVFCLKNKKSEHEKQY